MPAIRKLLPFLLFLNSHLWALNDLDRLWHDYQKGLLSFDDYMIYQIARVRSDSLLPKEYLTSEPIKCGTPVLKSLMENHHLLSASAKETLAKLGVDFAGAFPTFVRPSGLDRIYDSGIFRFHFTLSGIDGVDPTDIDPADGIPDYINWVADAFQTVYETEINIHGYARPPSDDWYPDNGGNGLYDIYVSNLDQNFYGQTVPEQYANHSSGDNENSAVVEKNAFTSYMEIRNSYKTPPFPNRTETQNIQVTAAHEFLHAIQFGYDGWEKTWLLESTATWMEDEVFDDINDNYQYLKIWFDEPHIALDYTPYHDYKPDYTPDFDSGGHKLHWYGSWIFFRYISEHIGGRGTIRQIFEQSVNHNSYQGDYTIQTINEALMKNGTSFEETLNSMVVANQLLSSDTEVNRYSYSEADAYKKYGVRLSYQETISLADSEYIFTYDDDQLMRYATHYIQLNSVDAPFEATFQPLDRDASFRVLAIIQKTSGEVLVSPIGTSTPIQISTDVKSTVIAVVSQNASGSTKNYVLTIIPEIPLPSQLVLYQNYPNPFNERTTFRFFFPQKEQATLTIFDLLGRKVGDVYLPEVVQGFNEATFEARHLQSGVYVARLATPTKRVSNKMMLIK